MKTVCYPLLLVLTLLAACSDSSNSPPPASTTLPIANATLSDPPPAGEPSLLSTTFPLADVGYEQQEFFIEGTARAFSNVSPLTSNGKWAVEPGATAEYRTRFLVYRPLDSDNFSGTVFMEWLNQTASFDLPVTYGTAHTELLRAGHAIVLASAQSTGVEGSENPLFPLYLKAVNPARYGELHHPGDSFSYDMFTQVAGAVRDSKNNALLKGAEVEYIFAMGQSGAASRLVTYYNAVQPLYQAFDGFLIQNRGAGSSNLAQEPQAPIDTPDSVAMRDDIPVEVITVLGETDVLNLGAIEVRRPDDTYFRLWEVAGAAHNDEYTFVSGRDDIGDDPRFAMVVEQTSILGFQECSRPMNSGYLAWPVNAAVHALDRWVRGGEAPASVPRLNLSDDGTRFLLDDAGNVTGGLRTAYVDAPAAILSGLGQEASLFCELFGTTALFDAATMASRYVDKAGYVAAVSTAVDEGVAQGTLLAADADRIVAAAALQWDALQP